MRQPVNRPPGGQNKAKKSKPRQRPGRWQIDALVRHIPVFRPHHVWCQWRCQPDRTPTANASNLQFLLFTNIRAAGPRPSGRPNKTAARQRLIFTACLNQPGTGAIFNLFRQRNYEHKRARNKRIGPGGGTRRLHQPPFIWRIWGRNRIDERL